MTNNHKDRQRLDELMRESVNGFTEYVGYTPVLLEPGICESTIDVRAHHLQQDGYVHAGVVTTLADHTAGYAAYSLAPAGTRILSVEFKINMLAPGDGQQLVCRAKVIKPGRRILVVESEVFMRADGVEKMVAKALLTMTAVPQDKLEPAQYRP